MKQKSFSSLNLSPAGVDNPRYRMVVWGRRGGGGGEERPRRCDRPGGGGGPSGGAPRRSTGTAPGSGSCCYSPENREEHLGQLFFSLSFFRFLLYIHTFISFISHEYSCNINDIHLHYTMYIHCIYMYRKTKTI